MSLQENVTCDQIPFAITSEQWVAYHKEQERKKSDKENAIKRRIFEKTLKNSAINKSKVTKKKTKSKEVFSETLPTDQKSSTETQGNAPNEKHSPECISKPMKKTQKNDVENQYEKKLFLKTNNL
ncbi:uncharacterized protein [Leptinotarsa decemlineata]|uniref:uncharacterized protein n=1 Tax=Leptinotarsa decemlineata TaxID=7539 RepID=UPI003D30AF29